MMEHGYLFMRKSLISAVVDNLPAWHTCLFLRCNLALVNSFHLLWNYEIRHVVFTDFSNFLALLFPFPSCPVLRGFGQFSFGKFSL